MSKTSTVKARRRRNGPAVPSVLSTPAKLSEWIWSMVVRLQAAVGDMQGALAALEAGLAANPGDPDLLALMP